MKTTDKVAYAAMAVLFSMAVYFVIRHVLDAPGSPEKTEGEPAAEAVG